MIPGLYTFDVHGDYIDSSIDIVSDETEYSFNESMRIFSALVGSIIDKEGNPLEGVEILSINVPNEQEPLSSICDGQFSFSQILSGSYLITLQKSGYKSVNRSIYLFEGTTGVIESVTLFPISTNYMSIIVASVLIVTTLIAIYLGSQKSNLFTRQITEQQLPLVEVSKVLREVEQVKPPYFGDYKGIIIKTIFIDGFHEISNIRENCGLEDDAFWDAFYELLSDGELGSDEKGLFFITEKLRSDWGKYIDLMEK